MQISLSLSLPDREKNDAAKGWPPYGAECPRRRLGRRELSLNSRRMTQHRSACFFLPPSSPWRTGLDGRKQIRAARRPARCLARQSINYFRARARAHETPPSETPTCFRCRVVYLSSWGSPRRTASRSVRTMIDRAHKSYLKTRRAEL